MLISLFSLSLAIQDVAAAPKSSPNTSEEKSDKDAKKDKEKGAASTKKTKKKTKKASSKKSKSTGTQGEPQSTPTAHKASGQKKEDRPQTKKAPVKSGKENRNQPTANKPHNGSKPPKAERFTSPQVGTERENRPSANKPKGGSKPPKAERFKQPNVGTEQDNSPQANKPRGGSKPPKAERFEYPQNPQSGREREDRPSANKPHGGSKPPKAERFETPNQTKPENQVHSVPLKDKPGYRSPESEIEYRTPEKSKAGTPKTPKKNSPSLNGRTRGNQPQKNRPSRSSTTKKQPQKQGAKLSLGLGGSKYRSGYNDGKNYIDTGMGLALGLRVFGVLGAELRYNQFLEREFSEAPERLNNPIQAVGQIYFFPNQQLSPFVSAGIVGNSLFLDDQYQWKGQSKTAEQEDYFFGSVLGLGLEYDFAKNIGIKAEGRYLQYQDVEYSKPAKDSAVTTSIGLVLHF
mgnify:CR=1 FL=1